MQTTKFFTKYQKRYISRTSAVGNVIADIVLDPELPFHKLYFYCRPYVATASWPANFHYVNTFLFTYKDRPLTEFVDRQIKAASVSTDFDYVGIFPKGDLANSDSISVVLYNHNEAVLSPRNVVCSADRLQVVLNYRNSDPTLMDCKIWVGVFSSPVQF